MATLVSQLYSQNHWADIDGAQTIWNFTFSGGYLLPSHVKAYYLDENGDRIDVPVTEDMLTGEFQLTVSPAIPATAQRFVIYRDTPKDTPLVDFADGARITERNLDRIARQAVFVAAEAADAVQETASAILANASLIEFTPAGETAVAASVQAKMRERVSITDHGSSTDWAGALIAAGAATSGVVHIPAAVTAISPSSAQVAGVLAMLNRMRVDGDLTITLPAGTHALTAQVVINTPDAQRITILGADPLSTTAVSQVSVSGSAKAYSVIVEVASSAGAAVGDYALIYQDATGTGDFELHVGVWRITAVDSGGANRLTLLNTHHGAAWPAATLTGGTVKIIKTMLQFTGCDGIRCEGNQHLGRLDQVMIVGDYSVSAATGTLGAHGIIMSAPVITGGASSNARHNMMGGASVGPVVGVSAFGEQGIAAAGRCVLVANYVASCSNRKRGWYAEGGNIRAKFSSSNGNGEDGYISDIGGALQVNNSVACGNGLNGYWSTNHSILVCAGGVAKHNLTNGCEARGLTRLSADLCTSSGNGAAGFAASDGGMIDADSAVADSNAAHGYDASSGGIIDCDNSTSTNNTGYGYRAQYKSVVRASGCTVSGNTTGDYYSRDSSLFESSGTLNVNDVPNYSVGQRFYNSTKANYYGFVLTSIGDMVLSSGSTNRFVLKADGTFYPVTDNSQVFGRSTERWVNIFSRQITLSPPSSVTPSSNGDVVFEFTSNTTLKIKGKGTDGTVRSVSLTLA